MSADSSDLAQFHRFVSEQLAQGVILTPENCLDIWRASHPSPDELTESVAAVRRGLEQARRGEGTPLDEFDRQFRAEYCLPPESE